MVNKKILKSKLALKGISANQLINYIGLSHSSYWYKINGRIKFNMSEISGIKKILELNNEEILDIFPDLLSFGETFGWDKEKTKSIVLKGCAISK